MMDRVVRGIKSLNVFYIVGIAAFLGIVLYWTSGYISGDAAIFWVFCKNFFEKPFSYYPGNVSYGATSPAYVLIYAIIYQLSGDAWFWAFKIFTLLLILASVYMVNKTIKGNAASFLVELAVVLYCSNFVLYASYVYETGLILLSLSALVLCITRKHVKTAIYISGLLYLVRPEMILITVVVDLYLLCIYQEKRKSNFLHMLFSAIPILMYTGYMWFYTREVIPSSIKGRRLEASANDYSWLKKLILCAKSVWQEYRVLLVALFIVTLMLIIFRKRLEKSKRQQICLISMITMVICIPYCVMPSVNHIIRYLSPLVYVFILAMGSSFRYIDNTYCKTESSKRGWIMTGAALLAFLTSVVYFVGKVPELHYSDEKLNTILGKDLAQTLEENITEETAKVLAYEIQQQYYCGYELVSIDAIVGDEMYDFLLKKKSLADVLEEENIRYIVTHQSAITNKNQDDTELETLYDFDLTANVGDSIVIDSVEYKKLAANDVPTQKLDIIYELNNGTYQRIQYADSTPWAGGTLFWTSLYQVIDMKEETR